MDINTLKEQMIMQARKRHGKIFPCMGYRYWDKCFTSIGDYLLLWYNTEDKSTHLLKEFYGHIREKPSSCKEF
jgi:hypothetical protein